MIRKKITNDLIGIVNNIFYIYWVDINIFHFRFKNRSESINFCIKHNISLKKERMDTICEIYCPKKGDMTVNEKGEIITWI